MFLWLYVEATSHSNDDQSQVSLITEILESYLNASIKWVEFCRVMLQMELIHTDGMTRQL